MRSHSHRTALAGLALVGTASLVLTACTGDTEADTSDVDCGPYEQYGTFEGEEVTIGGTILDAEADRLIGSWGDFEACTGIAIDYQGSREFEAQIAVLAEGGNAPDLGIIPQPGLLERLATEGFLEAAPAGVEANADEFWSEDWKGYGTVDGTFYAAPLMASVKGFIWYSPTQFEENGWEIPETLDELDALSEQIRTDTGSPAWCVGLGSGDATGWPGTDWIEDYVLRQSGPEVYDQWVTHEIPFNDPAIVDAFDAVGEILKNPEQVNAGLGDVSTVVSTEFGVAGLPILDGECALHHQGSFYEGFWPEGTTVAPDGDVYAFLLPPSDADAGQAVTGGGELVGAFASSDAITATLEYLSSDLWANNRVSLGGAVSANSGLDPANASSDVLRQAVEILQDPDATFRFDGSDLMPAAVGADSFWRGIVNWVAGASTEETVDQIESSWND